MTKAQAGPFSFVVILAVLFLLVYVWLIISPVALEPAIDTTIAATASSPNGDGIAFFLRILPWAVPLMLILGFLWWGVSR